MAVEILIPGGVSKQLPLNKVTYKNINRLVKLNTEYADDCAKLDKKYAEQIPEGALIRDVIQKPEYHQKSRDVALLMARYEIKKAAITLDLSPLAPEELELFLDAENEFWDDQDLEAIYEANDSFRKAARV